MNEFIKQNSILLIVALAIVLIIFVGYFLTEKQILKKFISNKFVENNWFNVMYVREFILQNYIKLLLGFVIIIFGGIFILGGSTNKILNSQPSVKITVDWKIYQNDKYKYQISYPAKWFLDEQDIDGKQITSISSDSDTFKQDGIYPLEIFVENNSQKLSAKDFAQNYLKNQNPDLPKIDFEKSYELKINDMLAYKLEKSFDDGAWFDRVYISGNDNIFVFNFPTNPAEQNKIYNEIISTFKFTK